MHRATRFTARRALRLTLPGSLLLFAATLPAQVLPDTPKPFRQYGTAHVTFGIGSCQHGYANVSFAGGGDAFLWRGITLGGEAGYFRFTGESGFGIGTINVGYNFANRKSPGRFEPYANFGLLGIGFAAGGVAPAGSLGGGVNTWITRKVGIRTEFRVYAVAEEAIAMFRVGLSFR